MLNNIVAVLFRYCEMSLPMLTEIKAWLRPNPSLDRESFTAPSFRCVSATNKQGDTVLYCPIETVFMVSAFAVNPTATATEKQRAGDSVDAEIENHAQMVGVRKLLVVLPDDSPSEPDEKWIRVVEKTIPQTINTYVGCSAPSQATQYLN